MTREEREKAIDALKISAPVMSVTQEEFNRVKSESPEKCFGDFFNL